MDASRRDACVLETGLIPERVMVCMSSSASAPTVIHAGAEMAVRMAARFYAVYVETPQETRDRIKEADRLQLERNIALAEGLGATVIRVRAERPADGLIAFAEREGITHAIFGQSARTRMEMMWKGSTLNRFLDEVKDATVAVVPL
ncbi:MAG TPA: universal stress protein [Vicinamibacterales bacterium]|nr:universal stress protein [Vicinamibacterales bacterium]